MLLAKRNFLKRYFTVASPRVRSAPRSQFVQYSILSRDRMLAAGVITELQKFSKADTIEPSTLRSCISMKTMSSVGLATAVFVAAVFSVSEYLRGDEKRKPFLHEVSHRVSELSRYVMMAQAWSMELRSKLGETCQDVFTLLKCVKVAMSDPNSTLTNRHGWLGSRLAELLADMAANEGRRGFLLKYDNGRIVDWLLGAINRGEDTSAHAASALSYFINDSFTCTSTVSRQLATHHLITYCRNHDPPSQTAAGDPLMSGIMDMVTSPADMDASIPRWTPHVRDVETSLKLLRSCQEPFDSFHYTERTSVESIKRGLKDKKVSLWADLPGCQVGLQLAAWSLALWAQNHMDNRAMILGQDAGCVSLISGMLAPERNVRWHVGSLISSLVKDQVDSDRHPWLTEDVAEKCISGVMHAMFQAGTEDEELAGHLLSVIADCSRASLAARSQVVQNGLSPLRHLAMAAEGRKGLVEAVAKTLSGLVSSGGGLSVQDSRQWCPLLLKWATGESSTPATRQAAISMLENVVESLGREGTSVSQAWLAALLMTLVHHGQTQNVELAKGVQSPASASPFSSVASLKSHAFHSEKVLAAATAAGKLARVVFGESAAAALPAGSPLAAEQNYHSPDEMDMGDVGGGGEGQHSPDLTRTLEAMSAVRGAMKAMVSMVADNREMQEMVIRAGGLQLVRMILVGHQYEGVQGPAMADLLKHTTRLLNMLTAHKCAWEVMGGDKEWVQWLSHCAQGEDYGVKVRRYARQSLLHLGSHGQRCKEYILHGPGEEGEVAAEDRGIVWPRYEDSIFLIDPHRSVQPESSNRKVEEPVMDIVFIHGLCGGPFKTWRLEETYRWGADRDEDTFWPGKWLPEDLPKARGITVQYETNLTEWIGATLPLQEISQTMLDKLSSAGVGHRPVVFVCHSMGGLIVKQMLAYAKNNPKYHSLLHQTKGTVFYSTPHWGSKLADMPWRMGLVLRPAPSVEDLRSTSPRLDELNKTLRQLYQSNQVDVLSFSEAVGSPLVRTYGGISLRIEIVPVESAYPGFGEIVVLDGKDHVNSCKPKDRSDIVYTRLLQFLKKVQSSCSTEG